MGKIRKVGRRPLSYTVRMLWRQGTYTYYVWSWGPAGTSRNPYFLRQCTVSDITVQHTKCYGNETSQTLLIWGRRIRKWQRNFQLSSSFWVTVMAWNFTFFQLNIRSPSSNVGNTLTGRRNSHSTMKSQDRLSSLQVFVTWSVKLLPVSSLRFLLSVVRKRSYCRWCPQVLSWELCRDSFSWHCTVIYCVVYL